MLKARKANRVVKIPEDKKDVYIALGYTITDMDGNMVHEHVEASKQLQEAQKEIEDLKAQLVKASECVDKFDKKNGELEKENAACKKEIESLKAQLASVGAAEPVATETKKTTKAASKSEK